jgi:formamidopyrimidine-DNA glycosylase
MTTLWLVADSSSLETWKMPELPEVETTVRDLRKVLPGRVFTGEVISDWENMFVTQPPPVVAQLLAGQAITDVTRRAKYVNIELTDDRFLVMHRKMTGNIFWREPNAPPDRYTHVVFKFQDTSELRFCDLRKFGRVYMFLSRAELNEHFKKLGPEPLLDTFTLAQFDEIITKRKGMLKPLLLDQALVVGLGNIYANEALFVSGIHPQRTPQSLSAAEREKLYYAIRQVLETGIENRGTTLSDYLDAGGQRGRNQEKLFVHDREKKPCLNCGTDILRIVVGQRSTYLCPTCQPTSEG